MRGAMKNKTKDETEILTPHVDKMWRPYVCVCMLVRGAQTKEGTRGWLEFSQNLTCGIAQKQSTSSNAAKISSR